MRKIQNPLLLGLLAGGAGNDTKMIGSLIDINLLKLTRNHLLADAAAVYLPDRHHNTFAGKLAGLSADYFVAALMGIPLVYVFRRTGRRFAVVKGFCYGQIAWLLFYRHWGRFFPSKRPTLFHLTRSFGNFLDRARYGVIAAMVITKMGSPDLFAQETSENEEETGKEEQPRKEEKVYRLKMG